MTTAPVTRLLVVEDDPYEVALLRHAMPRSANRHLAVTWVSSLAAAFDHLDAEPVDVVLLDLGLPDSVGLDTLAAVHERCPALPVVVLTDLIDDEVALTAVRSGAQDYVVKGSLDGAQLLRAVRQAAERGRLHAEVDRLAGRQRVLAELGRLAVRDAPLSEQLAVAADLLGACLGNDLALVLQRRADGRCTVQHATGGGDLAGALLPALLTNQLPRTKAAPVVIVDIDPLDVPALAQAPRELQDVRGAAALPLAGMGWSGAVVLLDRAPRTYDDDTLDFLTTVATLLTEAMRRAQAEYDLQERAKELSALATIGRLVQEPTPPRAVLAGVADALASGMQFPQSAVVRLEVDGEVVVSDDGSPQLAEELTAHVVAGGARRGAVTVGHREARGFLPSYEQQLVDAVAETLSLWLERQDTLARTRESEGRFRRLAENAQDMIYRLEHGDEPRFEYVSPAVEELLGVRPLALYQDPGIALQALSPEDRARLVGCVAGPQDDPTPFVAKLRRPDGDERWVEERHSYVFDDQGRHVATEGVVRDVTMRMQLEEALRDGLRQEQEAADALRMLNEMKDTFLTAVSHELRTPLTSLKGLSHTLREHDERLPPGHRRVLLERIAANADRLQELLDDLLDIDRLTRGTIELDLAEVDVASVVMRTLEELSFDGRSVTTTAEPVLAVVDAAKVERIVENLVLNAVRHTARDVPIWVRVRSEDDGVEIRVEDAGDGVPAALRSRIFEPFETGDSDAAKVGGLGIGLNIVARFAELHGGTVGVDERDGGGAVFHVWLPRTAVNGAPGVAAPAGARTPIRERSLLEPMH